MSNEKTNLVSFLVRGDAGSISIAVFALGSVSSCHIGLSLFMTSSSNSLRNLDKSKSNARFNLSSFKKHPFQKQFFCFNENKKIKNSAKQKIYIFALHALHFRYCLAGLLHNQRSKIVQSCTDIIHFL